MCGIAGAISLSHEPVPGLDNALHVMSQLIAHRGPDGSGYWRSADARCGFAHRRLAIIDLSPSGHQPMAAQSGSVITYNGEVYNYVELRKELSAGWSFRTFSDTETILAAYDKWGPDCLTHLRGMFAFAIWDNGKFLAARDRFGIKPFYYAIINGVLYFASEMKALLPLLPEVATDADALAEYMTFQYTIGEKTSSGTSTACFQATLSPSKTAISGYFDTGMSTTRSTGATRNAGSAKRCAGA